MSPENHASVLYLVPINALSPTRTIVLNKPKLWSQFLPLSESSNPTPPDVHAETQIFYCIKIADEFKNVSIIIGPFQENQRIDFAETTDILSIRFQEKKR